MVDVGEPAAVEKEDSLAIYLSPFSIILLLDKESLMIINLRKRWILRGELMYPWYLSASSISYNSVRSSTDIRFSKPMKAQDTIVNQVCQDHSFGQYQRVIKSRYLSRNSKSSGH